MAFLFVRPIASRFAIELLLFAGALAAVPVAESAAQTKEARPPEGISADMAAPAPAAEPQGAKDQPAAADMVKSGESSPSKIAENAQERDRRLVLLRLLVQGGGSYRPFGLFK
jgi:hypothetical protein